MTQQGHEGEPTAPIDQTELLFTMWQERAAKEAKGQLRYAMETAVKDVGFAPQSEVGVNVQHNPAVHLDWFDKKSIDALYLYYQERTSEYAMLVSDGAIYFAPKLHSMDREKDSAADWEKRREATPAEYLELHQQAFNTIKFWKEDQLEYQTSPIMYI